MTDLMENPTSRRRRPMPSWRARIRRSGGVPVIIAAAFLALLVLFALLIPLISPTGESAQSSVFNGPPSLQHWLGTDRLGRDTLIRLLYGARVSLSLGLMATILGGFVGTVIGTISGYVGGKLDAFLAWFIDVLLSFPDLVLGITIVVALGPGYWQTLVAIAVTLVGRFARLSRASTISIRNTEYLSAIKVVGAGRLRILARHVLPNISGDVIGVGIVWAAHALITESSLSFLGLGVQPPQSSWGVMVKDAVQSITYAPWVALPPGAVLALAAMAITIVGDYLQARFDPKSRREFNKASV